MHTWKVKKTLVFGIMFLVILITATMITYTREEKNVIESTKSRAVGRARLIAEVSSRLISNDMNNLLQIVAKNESIEKKDIEMLNEKANRFEQETNCNIGLVFKDGTEISMDSDYLFSDEIKNQIFNSDRGMLCIHNNKSLRNDCLYYISRTMNNNKIAIVETISESRVINNKNCNFDEANSFFYLINSSGQALFESELINAEYVKNIENNSGSKEVKEKDKDYVIGYYSLDKDLTNDTFYAVSVIEVGNIFKESKMLAIELIMIWIVFVGLLIPLCKFYNKYLLTHTALENAEDASEAKSTFLSSFSHDIRTPMNTLIGMTEIAKDSLDDKEKTSYCLTQIETSAEYILSMMSDILDISKIENRKLEIVKEPFALDLLIKNINSIMFVQAKEKKIAFLIRKNISSGILLMGDMIRLKQIIINLISNAIKFTQINGKVNFEIEEKRKSDTITNVTFRVIDNGVGMSKEFMNRMYKPFERSTESRMNSAIEGTGLGLAICKNLVSLMGGTIEVTSEIGVGTQFSVSIDFEYIYADDTVNNNIDTDSDEYHPYDFTGKKILLADDNQKNLMIMKEIIETSNLVVDTACNGQTAVNMFMDSAINEYDAILLDIQMPIKNGLEAANEIRNSNRADANQVKIAAMTANAFRDDFLDSEACGMDIHIVKPIKRIELFRTLDNLFKLKRNNP